MIKLGYQSFCGVWRDGKLLIVAPSGAVFPDRCVATDEPLGVGRADLRQLPFAGRFLQFRPSLEGMGLSETFTGRLSGVLRLGVALLIGAILLIVLPPLLHNNEQFGNLDLTMVPILASPFVMAAGGICCYWVTRRFSVRRMSDGYLEIRGAHPDFLSQLPQWSAEYAQVELTTAATLDEQTGEAVSVASPQCAEGPGGVGCDDDQFRAIGDALFQLCHPKTTSKKVLTTLAVSAVLFGLSLSVLQIPLAHVLILIFVIIVHELGHLAAMLLFGYKDVRMFFIPFFGAAVAGRATGIEGYKKAIVVLAGPLPGICISLPLIFVAAWLRIDSIRQLAIGFAAINGFNLLPVLPLDGGRLLQETLFSRVRGVEVAVNLVAAVALLLIVVGVGIWSLLLLVAILLMMTIGAYTTSTIAKEVRLQLDELPDTTPDDIPEPVLRMIIDRIGARTSQLPRPKTVASMALRVWEKMLAKPPGPAATVGLLAIYLFFFVVALIGSVVATLINAGA